MSSSYNRFVAVIVGPAPSPLSLLTNDDDGTSSDLRMIISALYDAIYEEAILKGEGEGAGAVVNRGVVVNLMPWESESEPELASRTEV